METTGQQWEYSLPDDAFIAPDGSMLTPNQFLVFYHAQQQRIEALTHERDEILGDLTDVNRVESGLAELNSFVTMLEEQNRLNAKVEALEAALRDEVADALYFANLVDTPNKGLGAYTAMVEAKNRLLNTSDRVAALFSPSEAIVADFGQKAIADLFEPEAK